MYVKCQILKITNIRSMAEAVKDKQTILRDIIKSLPSDMSKSQKKKQAKIDYMNMLKKEKPKPKRKKRKKPVQSMSSSAASKVRIAIELGYQELMSDKDIKMLMKQCQRCYSQNRTAEHPVQLYLTSFNEKCKERMEIAVKGYKNWDVHFNEGRYLDVFDRKEIVFLAAESSNILTELSHDKVYVIGGLVDHNRYKGHCYAEALAAGVSHAQLPLKEHVILNSRNVLTVNHVFEVLLAFENHHDWKKAINDVIPQRKVVTTKSPDSHVTSDKLHVSEEESPDSHVTSEESPKTSSPDSHVTSQESTLQEDNIVTNEESSKETNNQLSSDSLNL